MFPKGIAQNGQTCHRERETETDRQTDRQTDRDRQRQMKKKNRKVQQSKYKNYIYKLKWLSP